MPDYSAVIETLKAVDPTKPQGTELFNALARITVSVAIEAVCLRWNPSKNNIEVYLTQRSINDSDYPAEWHCPGSVLRPGEEEKDVFVRLSEKEISGTISSLGVISNFNHPNEERGHFFLVIHLCSFSGVKNGKEKGKWFSINNLPKNIVPHHRDYIIPIAIVEFEYRAHL